MAFWQKNLHTKRALGLGSTLLGGSLLAFPAAADAAPADAAPAPTDAPRTDATAPARPLPAARLNAAMQAADPGSPAFTRVGAELSPYGIAGPIAALVDLDDDGDLDAIGIDLAGNFVVQMNEGAASAPAFAAVAANPFGLTALTPNARMSAADVDGDGDIDVVGFEYESGANRAVLLENIGTPDVPLFTSPAIGAFGMQSPDDSSQPTLADVDDDGDMDLLIGVPYGTAPILVQENTAPLGSPPAFAPAAAPSWTPAASDVIQAALVDIDGDGFRDLIVTGSAGKVRMALNVGASNAAPSFDTPDGNRFGFLPFDASMPAPAATVVLADLDGDGDTDILGYDPHADITFLHENTGTATVPDFSTGSLAPRDFDADIFVFSNAAMLLSDLDGDGDLDILRAVATPGTTTFHWTENTGTPSAPAWADVAFDPFGLSGRNSGGSNIEIRTLAAADLNDDGLLDILAGDKNGNLYYFEHTDTPGGPQFGAPIDNPFGFSSTGAQFSLSAADLDGNGTTDLLLTTGGPAQLVDNTGTASAPAFSAPQPGPGGMMQHESPVLVDIDGDGDLDLFGIEQPMSPSGGIVWEQNTGSMSTPAFAPRAPYLDGLGNAGWSGPGIVFGDLDDDGTLDALELRSASYRYHRGEPAVVLPIELSAFDARVDGERVVLSWQTQSEVNALGFGIERRGADDAAWEEVAFVAAGGDRGAAYRQDVEVPVAGRYAFRLRMVDLDGSVEYSAQVEATVEVARSYLMSAAYPNPFNPSATFTLGVQRAQQVQIGLYDVLGRRVATLFDGRMEAHASHVVRVDGSRLASGTYVVRAVGEAFAATQQVTLVK